MTLSSNHKARLLDNLSKDMENETFHDLTIGLAEGHGFIGANKIILCSTYFASFFNNNHDYQNVHIKIPTNLVSHEVTGVDCRWKRRFCFQRLNLSSFKNLSMEIFQLRRCFSQQMCARTWSSRKYQMQFWTFFCEYLDDFVKWNILAVHSLKCYLKISNKRWTIRDESESDVENDSTKNEKENSDYEQWKHCHLEWFKVFVNWLSGNPDCDSGFKERILNYFDINRFTSEEFTTYVCKSSLYKDKCHLDVLGQKNILLSKRNNVLESHLSDIKKKT